MVRATETQRQLIVTGRDGNKYPATRLVERNRELWAGEVQIETINFELGNGGT